MTDQTHFKFLVLYGSETGNAKSIAEKLHEEAVEKGLDAELSVLDDFEKLGMTSAERDERILAAIVCSTTGNGDAPKGAEKFLRFVKKRTQKEDAIKDVSYCVLALGDTNYDKFCFAGKTIDTRLAAVGGTQLKPVTCVDEVEGLDHIVEPWIEGMWELCDTFGKAA